MNRFPVGARLDSLEIAGQYVSTIINLILIYPQNCGFYQKGVTEESIANLVDDYKYVTTKIGDDISVYLDALENHWYIQVHDYIPDDIKNDRNFKNEINKMKLKKGPIDDLTSIYPTSPMRVIRGDISYDDLSDDMQKQIGK